VSSAFYKELFSIKNRKYIAPYSKLALIYDDVMSHVDYKEWANYVSKIIRKWQPKCHSILDISCGTGRFLLSLTSNKIERIGFDMSFEMVKIANQKVNTNGTYISFYQGNMVNFYLRKKIDVIVCLYDSINYLNDFKYWQQLLNNVSTVLGVGGLFVFDVCTENNSLRYFNNYSERNVGIDYEYIRLSNYDKKNKIHENKFLINFDNDENEYVEIHRQKIFLLREILEFIQSTELKLLGYFDDFTFNRASEDSLRVHFVLKKQ